MDTPIVEMITRSGWVARVILLLLAVFSVASWAIIINRLHYYRVIQGRNQKFRKDFATLTTMPDVDKMDAAALQSTLGHIGRAGLAEYRRILDDSAAHPNVKDWSFFLQNQFAIAAERIDAALIGAARKLDKGVVFLAMVSSGAPFLGLFGTIWGIMEAFFEIGRQGTASLPVVAPGIAEALIAIIFALAVAVPAVFAYNMFMHRTERLEDEMEEFKSIVLARIKQEVFGLLYGNR